MSEKNSLSLRKSKRKKSTIDDFFAHPSTVPQPMRTDSSIDFSEYSDSKLTKDESNSEGEDFSVYDVEKDPPYSPPESDSPLETPNLDIPASGSSKMDEIDPVPGNRMFFLF